MTDLELIAECRKRGLQNGSTLGHHSGFFDIVADRLEELAKENNGLKIKVDEIEEKRAEDDRLLNNRVIESVNAVSNAHLKYIDSLEKALKEKATELKTAEDEAYKRFARQIRQQAFDRLYISIEEVNAILKEKVGAVE